jgi:hypothetical protein
LTIKRGGPFGTNIVSDGKVHFKISRGRVIGLPLGNSVPLVGSQVLAEKMRKRDNPSRKYEIRRD